MESKSTSICSQEHLADTLTEVNLTARDGLNKIEAIAQCMRLILERPDRQAHLVGFAYMVTTIRDLAQSTKDSIGLFLSNDADLNEMGSVEIKLRCPAGPNGHMQGAH